MFLSFKHAESLLNPLSDKATNVSLWYLSDVLRILFGFKIILVIFYFEILFKDLNIESELEEVMKSSHNDLMFIDVVVIYN